MSGSWLSISTFVRGGKRHLLLKRLMKSPPKCMHYITGNFLPIWQVIMSLHTPPNITSSINHCNVFAYYQKYCNHNTKKTPSFYTNRSQLMTYINNSLIIPMSPTVICILDLLKHNLQVQLITCVHSMLLIDRQKISQK